jgi:hypothetical protein
VRQEIRIPETSTYADGRKPINQLYSDFLKIPDASWNMTNVCESVADNISLPILSFSTKKQGPAIWIISGIHGEEPAGPIAISESIKEIQHISEKYPVVLIPLCNPHGYRRSWRYLDIKDYIEGNIGKGVGISEHLLLRCGVKGPNSPENDALTRHIISMAKTHPPKIVFDIHEDDDLDRAYVYSQGGAEDEAAKFVIMKYREWNVPVQENGKTRADETIISGIIGYGEDGSIDEFIASKKIRLDGKIVDGPGAKTMIVTELPSRAMKIKDRVDVYKKLLAAINSELLKASPPSEPTN